MLWKDKCKVQFLPQLQQPVTDGLSTRFMSWWNSSRGTFQCTVLQSWVSVFKWAEKNIPSLRPWFRTNLKHKLESHSGRWLLGMCWMNAFLNWGRTGEHSASTGHWKHIGNVKKAAALDLVFLPLQVRIKLCLTSQPLRARTVHLARISHESNETLEEKLGWSLCFTAVEVPLSSVLGVCVLLAPGVPEMEKQSFLYLQAISSWSTFCPRWLLIAAAGSMPQETVTAFLNMHLSQMLSTTFKLEVHRQRNRHAAGEHLS